MAEAVYFSAPVTTSVGTTLTRVCAYNPSRRYLLVQNLSSTANVTIAFGSSVTTTIGIKLGAGQAYEMNLSTGVDVRDVLAISDTAATNVCVTEGNGNFPLNGQVL